MKQLTLKDICSHLPYGLKSANRYVGQFGLTKPLIEDVTPSNVMKYLDESTKSQIVLRPRSDLTKEITHKGETFVPIDRIKESQHHLFFRVDLYNPIEGMQYSEVKKLQEWIFDINGLIEAGLAIDVNTLDQEIY